MTRVPRLKDMKAGLPRRLAVHLLVLALLGSGLSCTTTYDYAGRPVQRVDAEKVAVGLLLVGVIAYAMANGDDYDHRHHHRHHGYYCR